MKAVVQTAYGSPDVLKIQQVESPTPKPNEVLVEIMATSATAAQSMMRQGVPKYGRLFLGLRRPKNAIPGTDFAGIVAAVGREVTRFKVGDPVFGSTDLDAGCYAEYKCVLENGMIALKPANASFAEAAAILDGGITALHFLRDVGQIQPSQRVLINGASGGIGTAAVQLARQYGAQVTAVCSTTNVEMVKALGADRVIDYKQEDFTQTGDTYDIIFDTVGKRTFDECKIALAPNGIYLTPVMTLSALLQTLWTKAWSDKKAKFAAAGLRSIPEKRDDLLVMKNWMIQDKIKSVIDRCYPLAEIAEAHRYVDTGRKKGNVAILVAGADE